MKRKQAAALIDEVRVLAAREASGTAERLTDLLESYGLKPLEACRGEAHYDPFIDNCSRCAPRWGFVGKPEVVT